MIVFFRTLILYFMVVIVMRIMGKRQIGELQPFELVVAIMISELAAVPMADTEIPLINGIIPILTMLLIEVSLAYLTLKSGRLRVIVCGRPSLLIEKGKIVENELRRLRININDLLEQLRVKNYADLSQVDYAILETNGQLSVIPKSNERPVTTKDLGIKPPDTGLPITLVVDGERISKNFETARLSEEALLHTLNKEGIRSLEDILYASIDANGKLTWQKREGV